MRISTAQVLERATSSLLRQQSALNDTQNKISSGKRILSPADDPTGAARAFLSKQEITRLDRFQSNADFADNTLALQEFHFGQITNSLQRIRELHIQSSNNILGADARNSIKQEVQELLNVIEGIGNATDEKGNYIYSGYQSGTKPFAQNSAGQYSYQGDDGQRQLEVSSGLKLPISDSGRSLFEGIKTGNGDFSVSDNGIANTGTAVVTTNSVQTPSSYVQDTYTITFVTNSSNQLAYQVVGATSGQVVPALPATIPNDAPAFVVEQGITFNGIHLALDGVPVAGDDFKVQPSITQNALNTIKNMVSYLDQPYVSDAQQANVSNQANQVLLELDQALDQVLLMRTQLGARLNVVDAAKEINTDLSIHNQSVVSQLEDLDLTEAIIDLKAQSASLEATQQSFLIIQGLSLFNFL